VAAALRFFVQIDSFQGTPAYNLLVRLAGWQVGRGSIIMGVLNVEVGLLDGKKGLFMGRDAKIATHFIQSGRYHNVPIT